MSLKFVMICTFFKEKIVFYKNRSLYFKKNHKHRNSLSFIYEKLTECLTNYLNLFKLLSFDVSLLYEI